MALRQTAIVRDRLAAAHPDLAAAGAVEIVTIRTTGDRVQDRLLAEIGGKGLFAKEIEEALIAGHIDLAVHSLKDLETWLPDGLAIACVLPRDDPRDAFLSTQVTSLALLPQGVRVGTASLRRQAQLLRARPDLTIVPIRGNVNTRIRKLAAGEVDALVVALSGSVRLGSQPRSCRARSCCPRSARARWLSNAAPTTRSCISFSSPSTTREAPPASRPSAPCSPPSTALAAPRSPGSPTSTATG
jgi:hydroxymethylbilane synthase